MANERLELTFTGLCVMVIEGSVGTLNPKSVKLLMVDDGMSMHQPRLSYRGIDLGDVTSGEGDQVAVRVAPDSQEIFELPIPAGDVVSIMWESDALNTKNEMIWDESSDVSMKKVPDLQDFNVGEIFDDTTNTAATVNLPLGRFVAGQTVRSRGGDLRWAFNAGPTRVYTNQVTLISEAKQSKALKVKIGGKTLTFLSGDGEIPLKLSLTNLPLSERLIEPEIPVGQSPPHLAIYRRIAKVEIGSGFRVFKRTPGATRQGTICPVVRAHV